MSSKTVSEVIIACEPQDYTKLPPPQSPKPITLVSHLDYF